MEKVKKKIVQGQSSLRRPPKRGRTKEENYGDD